MNEYVCEYNYYGSPISYVVKAKNHDEATELAKARAKKDDLFLNRVRFCPSKTSKTEQ